MASDDLTQQLARIIGEACWDSKTFGGAARAVLASGLVVPTSAVNDLANEWVAFPNEAPPPFKPLDVYRCAADLRALTRQETPNV